MVFSVKLHFGLIPYPLPPYPLSLIPTPWSLSTSAVPFKKFRWGLFLSLSLLSLSLLLSQVKVKSTPSPRPKTTVILSIFPPNKILAVATEDRLLEKSLDKLVTLDNLDRLQF